MIPLPPRFTLFPYTTLFRSIEPLSLREAVGGHLDSPKPDLSNMNKNKKGFTLIELLIVVVIIGILDRSGDRKSTRLNSSHRCISYAVFCLKKKKKMHL